MGSPQADNSYLGSELGHVSSFRLLDGLILLVIDINCDKIETSFSEKEKIDPEKTLYINYCTEGRCEILLKNGTVTYLSGGEMAIDMGHSVQKSFAFRYPASIYRGIEILLTPSESLDKGLSLPGEECSVSKSLLEAYSQINSVLVMRPEKRIRECFSSLIDDASSVMPFPVLSMGVRTLLEHILKSGMENIERVPCFTDSQVRMARIALGKASADLSKRVSASEMAKAFGVSESSLKNYFKGVYGKGFGEAMNDMRMEAAAKLLDEGKMSIHDVASSVGYSNQSRFASAFRKRHGSSPMEYKRKSKLSEYDESSMEDTL